MCPYLWSVAIKNNKKITTMKYLQLIKSQKQNVLLTGFALLMLGVIVTLSACGVVE